MADIVTKGINTVGVANFSSANPVVINIPASTTVDDVVVIEFVCRSFVGVGGLGFPAGFTVAEAYVVPDTAIMIGFAYKIYEVSDGSTYTITSSVEFNASARFVLKTLDNVNLSNIIDAYDRAENFVSAFDTNTIIPAGITVANSGASVFVFGTAMDTSNQVSPANMQMLSGDYTRDFNDTTDNYYKYLATFHKQSSSVGSEQPPDISMDITASYAAVMTYSLQQNDNIVINNVTWEPPKGWGWIAYDGSLIPTESVMNYGEGIHTGSDGAGTLTDSSKNYTVDALVWLRVRNTVTGETGIIEANTATTITAPLSSNGTWSTGDTYYIELAADINDQMVYELETNLGGAVSLAPNGVPLITGVSGTHTFRIKFIDVTDNKVSSIKTVTVTVS